MRFSFLTLCVHKYPLLHLKSGSGPDFQAEAILNSVEIAALTCFCYMYNYAICLLIQHA